MSCVMDWDRPHNMEPARKIRIETKKAGLRPNTSLSLPYNGVVIVEATMNAVTTHDKCASPPRSLTMRGSAVATMF
jgi:hypothetical protein